MVYFCLSECSNVRTCTIILCKLLTQLHIIYCHSHNTISRTLLYLHTCLPITCFPHCQLTTIINWVVHALNADWLAAVVCQTIYHGYDKTFIFTALITLVTVYNSNKAPFGILVYGQYTMAKGCIQALRVASCLRTALSRGISAIYHTTLGLIT